MSDAEERLREEQRYHGIIERSPDGITLTDEQGLVIEWNKAMEQITGLKAETVLGRPIWDMELELGSKETRTPERREALRAAMEELLKTGQASWLERPLEREVCRPDGSGCFVRGTVFPIETGRGFMLGSISRDVTERRREQEELRRERDFVAAVLDTAGALYVNGTLIQTLNNLNTSAYKLDAVQLGPTAGLNANMAGTLYFDDLVSTRTTLIGP